MGPGLSQEDMVFLSGVESAAAFAASASPGQKRTHSISEGFNDHYQVNGRSGFQPEELIALDESAFNS